MSGILDNNAPAVEPVTLDEAKLHLRVDHADEDALIAGLVTAARQHAESWTQTIIAARPVTVAFDGFADELDLGVWPISAVTVVRYEAFLGTYVTLMSSSYALDEFAKPAVLRPVDGWPAVTGRANSVTVEVMAGGTVPTVVKQAILLIVGHLYENRESQSIPDAAETLLQPHRLGIGL